MSYCHSKNLMLLIGQYYLQMKQSFIQEIIYESSSLSFKLFIGLTLT